MSKINVYCVFDGMPGYLPNSVVYFTNKRAMLAYLADEARFLRDQEYTVTGSAEVGYEYDSCTITWDVFPYPTRAERDRFIADNQEI